MYVMNKNAEGIAYAKHFGILADAKTIDVGVTECVEAVM